MDERVQHQVAARQEPRSHRLRAVRALAAGAVLVALGAACSSGSGPKSTAGAASGTTLGTGFFATSADTSTGCGVTPTGGDDSPTPAGVDVGTPPTLPKGVDTGYSGSGPGSGNPYTALGARPVPGPDLPVTTLGPEPRTRVVAIPPNPDMGTPAATPAGVTTIPTPPTTLPAPAPTPAPGSTAPPTSGLMTQAADPGCVANPGDP